MHDGDSPRSMPRLWTLAVPLAFVVGTAAFHLLAPQAYVAVMEGELGVVEMSQFLVLVLATILAAVLTLRARAFRWYTALALVCCFYVAGE